MIIINSLFFIISTNALQGVDLSQSITQKQFLCLKQLSYSFAIIRGLRSNGEIDINAKKNINNSVNAGLKTDVYLFPCRSKSPQTQVQQLVNQLKSTTKKFDYKDNADFSKQYGMIWIDIQTNPSQGCSWNNFNNQDNCRYISRLVSAINSYGIQPGIFSSKNYWQKILGKQSCTLFKQIPLWYAHYDNKKSFQDWKTYSFGGWKTPTMKQYSDNKKICQVIVDLNYRN